MYFFFFNLERNWLSKIELGGLHTSYLSNGYYSLVKLGKFVLEDNKTFAILGEADHHTFLGQDRKEVSKVKRVNGHN